MVAPNDIGVRLMAKLQEIPNDRPSKNTVGKYLRGDPDLKGMRKDFWDKLDDEYDKMQHLEFMQMSKLNMCSLIVNAVVDDIALASFTDLTAPADLPNITTQTTEAVESSSSVRSSVEPTLAEQQGGFPTASLDAQTRWRRYHGASILKQVATDMLHYGEGFVTVDEEGMLHYAPSRLVAVESSDTDPWDRTGAIVKYYSHEKNREYHVLYIQEGDRVRMFTDYNLLNHWEDLGATSFSRVPVCPARTLDGLGIYEPHLSTIDRINFLIYERLVIADKQAFRELWLKGLPAFYTDPETGEQVPIKWSEHLLKGPGNTNILPGEDSDVKETAATDFSPLTATIYGEIKNLAALTSTPLYILDPSMAQQSAEGADKADKMHRTRIRTLRVPLGEAMSEAMSLSFEATGEPGKEFEANWEPLEDETMSIRAQTASQLSSILPTRSLWTDVLQLTPEQISQAEAAREEDRALEAEANGEGGGEEDSGGLEFSAAVPDPENQAAEDLYSFSTASGGSSGSAADWLYNYLTQHTEAPSADIKIAAERHGYTWVAVRQARVRLADYIQSTYRNRNGKRVRYWTLTKRK